MGYRFLLNAVKMDGGRASSAAVTYSIEPAGEQILLIATRGDELRIAQLHESRGDAEDHGRRLCAYLAQILEGPCADMAAE